MRKQLKIAAVAALLAVGFTANAQTTTGDIAQKTNTGLGQADSYVKVIDNKGTVKYLQSSNGITTFTNTTPNGGEVTTWQLGGELSTATTITTNGQNFTIDGEEFFLSTVANATATDAAASTSATTGWTVMVRDLATGQLQQVALTDVLKVEAIRFVHTQAANALSTATPPAPIKVTINVAGIPAIASTDYLTSGGKLFVYRNGAKLRLGVDVTVDTAGQVVLNSDTEFPMYKDDIVEIQYVK